MAQVKAGDVVQLKSGGPAMTALEPTSPGRWICAWFVEGKEVKTQAFPEESLQAFDVRAGNSQASFR